MTDYYRCKPITSSSVTWRNSVRTMRILCPVVAILALGLGVFAWSQELYLLAIVDAFLVGINVGLSVVQWAIFKL